MVSGDGGRPSGIRGGRPRLLGPRKIDPAAGTSQAPKRPAPAKKRVLFVCIGNSCRSQMAEAFARAYGSDIILARSAGVSPSMIIQPLTRQVLEERNLSVDDHFPKGMEIVREQPFDLIVNMSGFPLAIPALRVVAWDVPDPIGREETIYREVAALIESLVMRLILELRTASDT
jgi:arsenate reductase (thioredoxin)